MARFIVWLLIISSALGIVALVSVGVAALAGLAILIAIAEHIRHKVSEIGSMIDI